jgi:hypothetical protein
MLNHQPKRGGSKSTGVVPFRESKLTHMFMNHLTGPSASRTSMIVNVNPAADDFDETQHVLSYATTARNVKISTVDYNTKRRILAKESNVKLSPVKKIADLVKKFSPQKRKGTVCAKPAAKRQRSIANAPSYNHNKRPDGPIFANKAPTFRSASAKSQRDEKKSNDEEVERLREENFTLKITIDDLEQKLADCEEKVRAEVVESMNEHIQESTEWYEERIERLKHQLESLKTSNSKKASDENAAQKRVDEMLERINECEEEMSRMREEHEAELEEKSSELLYLTNIQVAEMEQVTLAHQDELRMEREQKEELVAVNGTLRHQVEELRVSHDALLAKYNELLSRVKDDSPNSVGSIDPPAAELSSPNFKKLPRVRCSDVASTAVSVDIKSPKRKGNKWGFMRSPAKVALGKKSPDNLKRSPLGNINANID